VNPTYCPAIFSRPKRTVPPHLLTQYIYYPSLHASCSDITTESHGIFLCYSTYLSTLPAHMSFKVAHKNSIQNYSLTVIHLILSVLLFCKSVRMKLKWHSTGCSLWRHWNVPFPTRHLMSFVGKVFRANYCNQEFPM